MRQVLLVLLSCLHVCDGEPVPWFTLLLRNKCYDSARLLSYDAMELQGFGPTSQVFWICGWPYGVFVFGV